jgi:hypothetical protein
VVLSVPLAFEICPTDHCDSLCVWVYWRQARHCWVSTADSIRAASSIAYGTGAQSNAELLADELGLSAIASDIVAPDTVLLTVGTDFRTSEYLDRLGYESDATKTSEAPSLTAVPATAAGTEAPTPTNLTLMTAGSVPCVR